MSSMVPGVIDEVKLFSAYSVPMYIRIVCPNVVFCIMKGALLPCERRHIAMQKAVFWRAKCRICPDER